jgi:hypothetical protein
VDIEMLAQSERGIREEYLYGRYFFYQGEPDLLLSTIMVSFHTISEIILARIHVDRAERLDGLWVQLR